MQDNSYDIKNIHGHVEHGFPTMRTSPIVTTNPTKMNLIVPIIPEPARQIMDAALLTTGVLLNILLGLAIVSNLAMRTSTNCYVISLVLANLVILLEPLQQTLRWSLNVDLRMNLDYVFFVTFAASVLTITLLNIEIYVVASCKSSSLHNTLLKTSTAVKGVLIVWIICVMVSAMELHMYDFFEKEVVYDIYVTSTVMFLIFPCFICVLLDCFILYDLMMSRSIDGMWPGRDVERFIFLVCVSVEFFLIMIPYRVVRALTLTTSVCCSDVTVETVYTMVKIHPVFLPITCFATTREFRQMTLHCRRRVFRNKQRSRA